MKWLVLSLTVGAVFGADQASKAWSAAHLGYYETVPLIKNYAGLTRHLNSGLANQTFSEIIPGVTEIYVRYIPSALLSLFSVFFLFGRARKAALPETLGFGFILGGGLSNLKDHWLSYYVLDTLRVFNGFGYNACNLADLAILLGSLLLTAVWARELAKDIRSTRTPAPVPQPNRRGKHSG